MGQTKTSVTDTRDDAATVIAIAVLAFIVADLAHEVIGHGAAYLAVGGRSFVMTSTRLIGRGVHVVGERLFVGEERGELYGRIFSMGGPLGNLVFAGLARLGLRMARRGISRGRATLFFSLVIAFNLFWAFGYLIFSGVLNKGDWMEALRGIPPAWLWRTVMIMGGVLLYEWTLRFLAREMRAFVPINTGDWRGRVKRMMWISYLSGGVIACAAAAFDPRGVSQVWESGALVTFGAAIGLLRMVRFMERSSQLSAQQPEAAADGTITRSVGWIAAAVILGAIFVGVFGPGWAVTL